MSAYDVIVVGAGPAGCAAAYHASRAGCRALILDRSAFPRTKTCGDGLSPRSCEAIARMGLRDLPDTASRGVRVASSRDAALRDSTVLSGEGYKVVSRYVLDRLLLDQAIAAGAQHWTATVVRVSADSGAGFVEVHATRGSTDRCLRARRVVCATGYRGARGLIEGYVSRTATWAVAARTYVELRDDLCDLEVYLAGASPTGEALGYGWVFPSFGGRANVGVGVLRRPGVATPKPERLVAEFIETLSERRPGLGFTQLQPVDVAPIPLELSASNSHAGVLIAGDAAGLAHPLTAEGISAALESGEAAARAVLSRAPDAHTTFRRRLAEANPLSFAAADRVQDLHDCARIVVGRGLDALTQPTATVGTSLRRVLLRATPRPVHLRAAVNEERDALIARVRDDLVQTVAKLNPFLGELLRDATYDPRARFGQQLALGLRAWRSSAGARARASIGASASRRGRAMPASRVFALAVMEALALVTVLHDDLADSAAQGSWGNHALSMVLVDALNAYALRYAYAQPRSVCRIVSHAAEVALRYELRAALDASEAEKHRTRARLALYRYSAALGTRNARYTQLSPSLERLVKALAVANRRETRRRLEPPAREALECGS